MKTFIYSLTSFLLVLLFNSSFAQTYNMPTNGYLEIHSDSGTIYDDGGPTGNYSGNTKSVVTIYPATPGSQICLQGTYDLEDWIFSRIKIYDGDTNSTWEIGGCWGNGCYWSGSINVVSYSGAITIRFSTDTETPLTGFEINFNAISTVTNLHVFNETHNSAEVNWTGTTDSLWIIKLRTNSSEGERTYITDTNYIKFDSLPFSCTSYPFMIYTTKDSANLNCFSYNYFYTNSSIGYPYEFNNTYNSAEVSWTGTTDSLWIIKLQTNSSEGVRTYITDTNYIKFDSLPFPCRSYYYQIYTPEDSANMSCSYSVSTTSCSIDSFEYKFECDSLEIWWVEQNTNIQYNISTYMHNSNWSSCCYAYYTSDTNFMKIPIPRDSTFDGYINENVSYYFGISISADCNNSGYYCNVFRTSDIPIECCCPKAKNLQLYQANSRDATIIWDADSLASGWIVEYYKKQEGRDSSIFINVTTNSVFIDNLRPITEYSVIVHSLCDSLIGRCAKMISFFTQISGLDNCLTFTDLKDTNFAPKYGNYSNPSMYNGLMDYGYNSQYSRHTVHYDTSEYDPRTDSLLRTIPYGEEASVRLGNWLPGAEGESFTYAYDVDTNIFDLMYLRYAVVMENPNHTPTNQPRFTLEILNANDSLIDDVCGFADFYASSSLGWNSVPGTVTIWKDWTLVGFDISPYHGQRIYVRLTTRDCDEGGHFGYAYYHLKCGSKRLISDKCGLVDSNTFTAPIGFNYRWYSSANPSITLSTERKLDAVVDSTVNYHCLVSSTENASCTFLYTAYGGYRYPLSQLDYSYTWQPCSYTINFTNLSTISPDGINPAGTGESCETAKWIFPDGDTITTLNAVKTFSDTSEIKVRLISGIANDQCVDILDTIIKLNRPYPDLNIFGDSVVCKNDTAVLYANHGGKYFWSNQDTTISISFVPLIDTIYSLELIDSLGCYSFDSINIIVNPRDTTYITAEICDNDTYINNGFNTNVAGIHELKLFSLFNCDSIVYLDLSINPTYNDTIYAEICNGSVYDSNGFNDSITGFYTLQLQTLKGCDSIVNLNLIVHPTYNDTIFAHICEGEIYSSYDFNERVTGFYTQNLQTIMGCDSIVNLNLIVGEKYNDTIFADICKGEIYNQFGFNEIGQGFYTHSFLSQYGCDSIVNLSLLVHEPYYDTIYDTICNGDIYEYGFNADSSGTYVQNLNTQYGCDSILVLHLQVNPTYADTIKADIYKGNVYNLHGFNQKETGVYEQKYQTYLGCDSIIYLDLQVDYIMFPNVVTPNGDGINDIFEIHNLIKQNAFPENELIIYSRQGKLIYRIENIKEVSDFWDPQKTNSTDGTYFYRFYGKRHDKVLEFNGSIEIIR